MIFGLIGKAPNHQLNDDARHACDTWLAGLNMARVTHPAAGVVLGHTASGAPSVFSEFIGNGLTVVAQSRSDARGREAAQRIAEAYRNHGLGLSPHLEGSLAFILYDELLRRVLATSTMTSRLPLAYFSHQGTVVVGSRVMPLLKHANAPRALSDSYLAHWLIGSMSAPLGATPLRDVRRLLAGHALVVRDGEVKIEIVDALHPHSSPPKSGEAVVMWEQIRNAVGQALRSAEKPCISLSGGLDSSTVAAAALGQVQQLSAFCIVAPRLGGSDESRAISALGDMFSYLRLERVDCSDANAYPAVASAELRDDPTLMPLSLFPARLRLWGAVREAGYQTLIDGEGGDELFSICVTAFDAVLRGDWRSVLRHLRWHPGRRAALQRAVVVPLLPKPLRMAWARRQLRHVGFPAYVSPGALQLRELNDARQQYVEALVHQSSRDLFEQWLSLPVPVGATASHDRCAAEFGLRTVSPLLDRRVVELMLALPPSVLLPRGQDRHFQREVLKGRIPESVRMLSKDVRLPDELLPHIVCSQQARASLRDGAVRERLSGWVRFERLDAMLDAIPRGYRPAAVPLWQLECIVTFADWYSRAAAEFGVS